MLTGHTTALLLALRRKLAVWASIGGWFGIGRWPIAMPTMAVMWVSVPKTWMGIPVVFPKTFKTHNKRTFKTLFVKIAIPWKISKRAKLKLKITTSTAMKYIIHIWY